MSAQTMSGDARLGLPYMLSSVAAVVIGGISLAGGRGSMTGAVCGACILVLLGNIIYFAGIPSNYQEMFKGAVVMIALAFPFVAGRKPCRKTMSGALDALLWSFYLCSSRGPATWRVRGY